MVYHLYDHAPMRSWTDRPWVRYLTLRPNMVAVLSGVLLMAGTVCGPAARAAHPLITEDTGTQGQGRYQLELTNEHGHDAQDEIKTHTVRSGAVLSYGWRDDADLIFSLPYQRVSTSQDGAVTTARGLADAGVDVKWRFHENDKLSLALKPGISLATGDDNKGLGSGRESYSLFLVTTYAPHPWALHLHLGYLRHRNVRDERQGRWHASVGGWREIGDSLKLVADAGADAAADKSAGTQPSFLILGLIYSVTRDLDFDLGVKRRLTHPETDRTVLAGLTLRF